MKFDKIIIGRSIKTAIQVLKSKERNEKIAHIFSYENRIGEPFKIFNFIPLYKPFSVFQQNSIIKILKQKASHLLISTQIEEYRKISKTDRFFIKLNNLFFIHQISIDEKCINNNYCKLSYKSYKFSTNRLINSIIKSASNEKYTSFKSLKSYTKKSANTLLINNDTEISANKIIKCNRFESKKNAKHIFWFSCSNKEFNLDKSIIINTQNNIIIKIIPWFDYIYVEFTSKNKLSNSIEQCIKIIEEYNINVNIKKEHVLASGFGLLVSDNHKYLSYLGKRKDALLGSNFDFEYNPWQIMEFCDIKYDEAKAILKSSQAFKKLFYKYGTDTEEITYLAYDFWNEFKNADKAWLKAEIHYLANTEQCENPADYINIHTDEWLNAQNLDIEFIENCFA